MKAIVDPDLCVACGLCVGSCPDVFEFNGEGKAEAVKDPEGDEEACAVEARDNCPVSAISIEE